MNNNFISILPTEPFRQKLEDVGKLLLRLLFGLSLALNHGWPTFRGAWNGVTDFPDPLGIGANLSMWLAGSAEFGCALLVVFGLLTRFAAIPVLLNFVVAFFIFHADDPFGQKELAYLYLSAFAAIGLLGPGRYSMDYRIFNHRIPQPSRAG